MGNNALDVTQDQRSLRWAVGYQVQVIRHDDVRENEESARLSALIKGLAGDSFDESTSKYRKPTFGDGGDEEAGCISGDSKSLVVHSDFWGAAPELKGLLAESQRLSAHRAAEPPKCMGSQFR